MSSPVVLVLAPYEPTFNLVFHRIQDCGYTLHHWHHPDEELPITEETPKIALLPICAGLNPIDCKDLIKEAKQIYPGLEVLGVFTGRERQKTNPLQNNGLIEDSFQIPFEEEILVNKLFEIDPIEIPRSEVTFQTLKKVHIDEVKYGDPVPFDFYLYLPWNQKVILYMQEGTILDQRIVRKFAARPDYSLYIKKSDIKKYQNFCNKLFLEIYQDEGLSKVQKNKKIAEKLRTFMGGFFSDQEFTEEEGKELLAQLRSLTALMEDESGSKKDLLQQISHFVSQQMNQLTHSQNVAVYSCLFGLTLGFNEPETLRMGGLLHDIGLADLDLSLIGKDPDDMDPEDAARYKLHPGNGKLTIEQKKLRVPKAALDMVVYHHERVDGSGYPYGKKGNQIPAFAKICAFADEFDKLTSVREGYQQYSPEQALRRISGLDGEPPSAVYDPKFHGALIDHFLENTEPDYSKTTQESHFDIPPEAEIPSRQESQETPDRSRSSAEADHDASTRSGHRSIDSTHAKQASGAPGAPSKSVPNRPDLVSPVEIKQKVARAVAPPPPRSVARNFEDARSQSFISIDQLMLSSNFELPAHTGRRFQKFEEDYQAAIADLDRQLAEHWDLFSN